MGKLKELPPQDTLAQLFVYDGMTGDLFWNRRSVAFFKDSTSGQTAQWKANKWNSKNAGRKITCLSNGYYKVSLFNKNYMAHRVIWKIVTGADAINIDHINGVTSDNRISNLRDVTHAENQKNRRRSKNNTSGVTGVYRSRKTQMWQAQIKIKGRMINLGSFAALGEAVEARKKSEKEHGFHKNHDRKGHDHE